MSLRSALLQVLAEYGSAKSEKFAAHPLANFIRGNLTAEIDAVVAPKQPNLDVVCSPGKGNWADVPWAAVFEITETDTATRGLYVVYLFNVDAGTVSLTLNQGTTNVRAEFGKETTEVLLDRSRLARSRLKEWSNRLPVEPIALGSRLTLPRDYEAGYILGPTYSAFAMPSDEILTEDLHQIIDAYRALLFRGPPDSDDADQIGTDTVQERRRYAFHRRIERNSKAAKLAKEFHGTKCQACGMDFGRKYGELGAGYIEAHHMRPISSLKEGETVEYDIEKDFAVLCSNCHRMIHRMEEPSDLVGLRKTLRAQRDLVRASKVQK